MREEQCIACWNEVGVQFAECSSRWRRHKWCSKCLEDMIRERCKVNQNGMHMMFKEPDFVCCSGSVGGKSILWTIPFDVIEKVVQSKDVLQMYIDTRKAVQNFARQKEKYVRNYRRISRNRYKDLESARQYVASLATMKCPKCLSAFSGYTFCAIVRCGTCSVSFCGHCVEITSEDSAWKKHVMTCRWNVFRRYALDESQKVEINNRRFKARVEEYLRKCGKQEFKKTVIEQCQDIFKRHNFRIQVPRGGKQ